MLNIYSLFFIEFFLSLYFTLILYWVMQKTIQKIHLFLILICLVFLIYFSWSLFTQQNLFSNSKNSVICAIVLSTLVLNLFNLKGSKIHHLTSFILCCSILSITGYFSYSTSSITSSGSIILSLLVLQSSIYLSSKIVEQSFIFKITIASSMLLLFLMIFMRIENELYQVITSVGLVISSVLLIYAILKSQKG